MNPLIDCIILSVELSDDKHFLKFNLLAGAEPIIACTHGGCCSHTYIENIENPENLLGLVTQVEDLEAVINSEDTPNGGLLQYYACKIHTDKGTSLIDYRNESNGYYGGELIFPGNDNWYYENPPENVTWEKIA